MEKTFELYLVCFDMLYEVAKEMNQAILQDDEMRLLKARNVLRGVLQLCNWSRLQTPFPELEHWAGIRPQTREDFSD